MQTSPEFATAEGQSRGVRAVLSAGEPEAGSTGAAKKTTSMSGILNAAMVALEQADAALLEQLAEVAGNVRRPEEGEEQEIAGQELRAFARLIALTGRNVRLLRGSDGYAALRG
jgi:hypothetical protein